MRYRGIIVGAIAVLAVSAATVIALASLPVQTSGAVSGLAPISISPTGEATPAPQPTRDDRQGEPAVTVTPAAPAAVDDKGGDSGHSGKGSSGGGSDDSGSSGSGKDDG
jgi:uncharacterized membrane protein YgcG